MNMLLNKVVVFTGTLQVKRADAKTMAESAGATVAGSVTGKTDILVAGADAGSKVAVAKAKGVAIWDEDKFVASCCSKTGDQGTTAAAATAASAPAGSKAKGKDKGKTGAVGAPPPAAATGKRKADDTPPLAGMAFLRTGSFEFNKAVGEFVTSLGGTWVKKAKDATAAVNGRGEAMHTVNWSKNIAETVAMQKPIVIVEMNFTGGKAHSPAVVESFLDALEVAKALASTHFKVGKSASDVTRAIRRGLPQYSLHVRAADGGRDLGGVRESGESARERPRAGAKWPQVERARRLKV